MAYTTLANIKTYLDIQTTADDALINDLIARAQSAIDSFTKRTFEAAGDTVRYFDAVRDTNGDVLFLDEDLAQITTVDNDGTILAATDYTTIPRNDTPYTRLRITCTKVWCYSNCSVDAIEITGRWAYSIAAPDDIVHATNRLVAFWYRQKDSQVFDTITVVEAGVITVPPGLPNDVLILLNQYKKETAV